MILECRTDSPTIDSLRSKKTTSSGGGGGGSTKTANITNINEYCPSEEEADSNVTAKLAGLTLNNNRNNQQQQQGFHRIINSNGASSQSSCSEDDDESMSSVTSASDDDLGGYPTSTLTSSATSSRGSSSRRRLDLGVKSVTPITMANEDVTDSTDGGVTPLDGATAAAPPQTAGHKRINSSNVDTALLVSGNGDVVSNVVNQQQQHVGEHIVNGARSSEVVPDHSGAMEIREVWHDNLYLEFQNIAQLVSRYPFVAMDTEFPGVVMTPTTGSYTSVEEYKYKLVKVNVDSLKMIQLGLTLFDEAGNRPPGICTWQFNFKFSLSSDLYAKESIGLLISSGIHFEQHKRRGIEPKEFAEILMVSGLVLMDNITWLTFHSAYDFGYLLRQLSDLPLPESEAEFVESLHLYFPNMYDIKYCMSTLDGIHGNGGLQRIADDFNIQRIGSQHQAGSDSLLTGQVFFKMYELYFREHGLDDVKYNGQICGLSGSAHLSLVSQTPGRARRRMDLPIPSPPRDYPH